MTMHRPPIFCQKCHCNCSQAIVNTYINKEAEIYFEFICLKCGGEPQMFKMNFQQAVAYCICMENKLACYCEQTETIQ